MESHETEDVRSKLEVLLKARNKILCNKEVDLPCAFIDDIDLSDVLNEDNIPQVQPHRHLQDNTISVNTMIENINKLKHISEREMDFVIDERKDGEDELKQTISRFRLKTEKLIKSIINTQVEFNECLSSDIIDNLGNKNYIEKHSKLVQQTCTLDRGIESVISCTKDKLENNIEKDLKIKNEDELKKVSSEIAQGVLNKVFEAGKKTFKSHQHLQAITQYNQPTTGIILHNIAAGTIDPFTKQKITKPVRNKVCTHIYDQESVNLMFNGKSVVPCPYIGCSNKRFTKKDLVYEFTNE